MSFASQVLKLPIRSSYSKYNLVPWIGPLMRTGLRKSLTHSASRTYSLKGWSTDLCLFAAGGPGMELGCKVLVCPRVEEAGFKPCRFGQISWVQPPFRGT